MAKTHAQIKLDRKQKLEERCNCLIENPEVYRRDFDEALKRYLMGKYPEVDPEDCDIRLDPAFREGFVKDWPQEAKELSIKYNLVPVWDPAGDDPPCPVTARAARSIRCQDDRIWLKQVQKNSIINLPPRKEFGRFLIAEIDLSKPKREIEADIMSLVDAHKNQVKVSGFNRDVVPPPEPRNRDGSFIFKKMEVWNMVEGERQNINESEDIILNRLAHNICSNEGLYPTYKFEGAQNNILEASDPLYQERKIAVRKALKNAYERDKIIYYG